MLFVVLKIWLAFLLDVIFGDPQWLPHPIVLIGKLISWQEGLLRKIFPDKKVALIIAGGVLAILTPLLAWAISFGILSVFYRINFYLGVAVEIFMIFQIFAAHSLRAASLRVYNQLKVGDIIKSRKYLSWIVGRDVDSLDTESITKAVIETVAENTSDGVIAPMMFIFLGGAPLGFCYKAVNTLDSMVGYKNNKYIYFGRISAKLDDAANWIPARITALTMVIYSFFAPKLNGTRALKILARDRYNHSSPNSGQSEAACAGAIGIQLGGNAYYFGQLYEKKTIGDPVVPVVFDHIKLANQLMYGSSILALILFSIIRVLV